jgi:ribonuclease HII
MLYYERKLKKQGCELIIGVDEAGRGPLAGPVVAAAVILKTYRFKKKIDDSKKLTPLQREAAFPEITQKSIFGIGIVPEGTIDRINILQATRLAMKEAVTSVLNKLSFSERPKVHVIVDGDISIEVGVPQTSIISGDAKSKSIAAASILAKVTRDRIMQDYDSLYPDYGFARHKGYPTEEHRAVIRRLGTCLIHRKSFCSALQASIRQ